MKHLFHLQKIKIKFFIPETISEYTEYTETTFAFEKIVKIVISVLLCTTAAICCASPSIFALTYTLFSHHRNLDYIFFLCKHSV